MNQPYERQLLKSAFAVTPQCLSIEDLGRYADGTGDPAWKDHSSAHLATCARCQTELSLLSQFHSQNIAADERDAVQWIEQRLSDKFEKMTSQTLIPVDPGPVRKIVKGRRFFSFGLFGPATVMAGLLIVASGSFYFYSVKSVPNLNPQVEGPDAKRSGVLQAIEPKGDVDGVPESFAWKPATDAIRYEVRLMEIDQNVLWKATTTVPKIELPADVRSRIVPAKTLLWEVDAFNEAGAKTAGSGAQRFRLKLGAVAPQ